MKYATFMANILDISTKPILLSSSSALPSSDLNSVSWATLLLKLAHLAMLFILQLDALCHQFDKTLLVSQPNGNVSPTGGCWPFQADVGLSTSAQHWHTNVNWPPSVQRWSDVDKQTATSACYVVAIFFFALWKLRCPLRINAERGF